MECSVQYLKLCHVETRRRILVLGVVAVTYVMFQCLLLPYENAHRSLLPQTKIPEQITGSFFAVRSSTKSVIVRNPLTVNSSVLIDAATARFGGVEKYADNPSFGGEIVHDIEPKGKEGYMKTYSVLEEKGTENTSQHDIGRNEDENIPSENSVDIKMSQFLVSISNEENGTDVDKANEARDDFMEPIKLSKDEISTDSTVEENTSPTTKNSEGLKISFPSSHLLSPAAASLINGTNLNPIMSNTSSFVGSASLGSDVVTIKNGSVGMTIPGKKKMRCNMPPKSIMSVHEMNYTLLRNHAKGRALKPRWPSARDQDILAVKSSIQHPPGTKNDRELYAPLFRNVSMFKRSYELMERRLKVYIYKEGNKPIFHQPVLKGLYASEGWFMKLMEGHKGFVVKDPQKAHLFYMPFSSRMLQLTLYVRNSHNRTNLRQRLKEYSETIAAKYPYWNRTDGADHFLVACHDWAAYETRHHMERCIKALCNADVTQGFKIGRDVSLPETYVRSAKNPLRDLGGKPASERQVLAFYAGNVHGYLRPVLLKYWKDKDPDMKIFGPMPPGVASKMNYIEHMKSSKFCICPKGYEVNSPRVVEAIFYECIPVIISDNFVPPFLEVLNWSAFSVILAEKDIPNLKDILVSIPEEKYLEMQLAVKKVQTHFLWHPKPIKFVSLSFESKVLMGDVYIESDISEMRLAAYTDTVMNRSLLIDSLGFFSSIDDIFDRLLMLANYIGQRFIQFVGDLALREADRYLADLVSISGGQHIKLLGHRICRSCSESSSLSSKPYVSGPGPEICESRASGPALLVDTISEIVKNNSSDVAVPFISKGLMLPLYGIQFAWRLALSCWRCSFLYVRNAHLQLCSIASRVKKTLRGSSDDIGWLQRIPNMPCVEDGTERFLELLAGIRKGDHTLPDSFVYLLIPGLFSNHSPLYFVGTKRFFSKMGLACHIAKLHSEVSVEHNAWELKHYIEELYWGSGKRVMLLGHSKGGVDASAALSIYWSDLKDKVAGLALVQCPYGGTPLASDILRDGQIADKEARRIMEFLICKLIKGDIRALEDLTYDKRKEFIMKYKLPTEHIPLISFYSEASIAPGVLATMTHIAHAELPWLPLPKFGNKESDNIVQASRQMPVVIPLSAAMAVCALHLQLRYGEKSDGLVTCRDAEVPGSVVIRPDQKLDHAWMVYSSRKKNPSEADASEMCAAILTMLVELGEVKRMN